MSVFFAVVSVLRPHAFFITFLVLFLLGSAYGCYRVFFTPDDWYQQQEKRESNWFAQHPYLGLVLVVVAVGGFAWRVYEFIRG